MLDNACHHNVSWVPMKQVAYNRLANIMALTEAKQTTASTSERNSGWSTLVNLRNKMQHNRPIHPATYEPESLDFVSCRTIVKDGEHAEFSKPGTRNLKPL